MYFFLIINTGLQWFSRTLSKKLHAERTWVRKESLLESCTQEKMRTGKFSFSMSNIPPSVAPWVVGSVSSSERCFTMNLWEMFHIQPQLSKRHQWWGKKGQMFLTYFCSISTAWYPAAGSSFSSLVIRKMYSELEGKAKAGKQIKGVCFEQICAFSREEYVRQ